MINTVTVTNLETGEDLVLTLASPEMSRGFAVVNMDGLGPVKATINRSAWVTIDGEHVDSVRLPGRSITMALRFVDYPYIDEKTNKRQYKSIADIRRESYIYFPVKKQVRLTFDCRNYNGKEHHFCIDGYVETNNPNIWSKEEGATITFICPDPYFYSVEPTIHTMVRSLKMFHFKFPDQASGHPMPVSEKIFTEDMTITNESTVDTGVQFVLEAYGGDVVNPKIFNRTTREVMTLNYTLHSGDVVEIDTRPGQKSIKVRDGSERSRLQYLDIKSKWIKLIPGTNMVGAYAEKGLDNLYIECRVRNRHPGI